MLRAIFEDAGYEVAEAAHGEAALDLMRGADLPDVVTTDLMMPVMGGNELIHRLRSEPRTALIPILVVSANAGAAEGLRAAEGADAVIAKPFVSAQIVLLVQYLNGAAPRPRVTGVQS